MYRVFSNEQFLRIIQESLKTFESGLRYGRFDCAKDLLNTLAGNTQLHTIIRGICHFRLTNCDSCLKYLDWDDGEVLCANCIDDFERSKYIEAQNEALERAEMEEQRRIFERRSGLYGRW
jgi:hypothetical protein